MSRRADGIFAGLLLATQIVCGFISTAIVCSLLVALPPALAQETKTIQAGVTERVSIAPLDASLAPGKRFDRLKADALINSHPPSNAWHKIPTWYAGHWKRDKITRTYLRDEITGKEDRTPSVQQWQTSGLIGEFQDTIDQIWSSERQCTWTLEQGRDADMHTFTGTSKETITSEGAVETIQESIVFVVDKKTQLIKNCVRATTDSKYEKQSDTTMTEIGQQRTYNWQGTPIQTAETEAVETKYAPFENAWQAVAPDGQLLYLLWGRYLCEHDMAGIIPAPPPPMKMPAEFTSTPAK